MKRSLLFLILILIGFFVRCQVQVVTLDGSKSSDTDGVITHYRWIQVGTTPSVCKITNDTMSIASVVPASGAQWTPGVYTFRLTVTDNGGAQASDDMTVTWTAPKPVVDAGVAQLLTLPTVNATLKATGSTALGIVKSWAWVQINGPVTAIFSRKDTSTVVVSGLSLPGTYGFKVTVTDNYGQIATDSMTVTVKAANVLPKANAGPDKAISLPVSGVAVGGLDSIGASVAWTKVAGPSGAFIVSPFSSMTQITGLVRGTYIFRKTAAANSLTASDDVVVAVMKSCPWWKFWCHW